MSAEGPPRQEGEPARGPLRPWYRATSAWTWLGALVVAGLLIGLLLLAFAGDDDELVVVVPAGVDVSRFDPDGEIRVTGTLRAFEAVAVFDRDDLEDLGLSGDAVLVAQSILGPGGDALDVEELAEGDIEAGRRVTVSGEVGAVLGPRTFVLADD